MTSMSFNSLTIFFSVLFFFTAAISATQGSNETDRLALLAIKAQITHDPYEIFKSWNDSVHFCKWVGVICGHLHQRIVTLNLSSFGLVGTLSPYVSNLTFLTGINLELNNFHGEIPPEIGGLFRLRHLNLTNNSFSGEIPANLSGCSSLVLVRLGWNKLSGTVPIQLGTLPNLQRFQLHFNNFTGEIPESFGNLSSIRSLSFAANNFQGSIPAVLGKLKTLNFLGLGVNQFNGMIPREIFNLSSLVTISVPYNQLEGILPLDLGFNLPNLQVLNLGHNLLTGPLPYSLSNASNLVEFDITGSRFTGKVSIDFGGLPNLWWLILASNPLGSDLHFLNSLVNCKELKMLDLSDCRFGGTLPYSIANLSTNLVSLRLGGNELAGGLSVGFENLVNLTELQLQNNRFTGIIPAVLGNLSKLQLMDLSENELFGYIPSSMSKLSQLYSLHLEKNHLNESIPMSFGNFQYLQQLDLSENHLTGAIPENVMSLSFLTLSLNLAYNRLSGSLPSQVGGLKNLECLDVSENELSGEIPSSIGGCITLERLNLAGNSFQGPIPSSFSSLRGLEYLNLSCNNLSGQIPEFLQSLSLKNLNLSFNRLEGKIPIEGVFRDASSFSVIGNNKLCGGIQDLHLATCPENKFEKRKPHRGLELMIPLLSGLLVLVLIFSLLIIRRLRKKYVETSVETSAESSSEFRMFAIVTYESLFKATDGFSQANLVGSGSFGSVYKGILEPDETPVAVKVFHLNNQGNLKSFMSECRTLRNIRHRNLVKIYTSCSTLDFSGHEFKALVYEFMSNGSLESWLHGNPTEQNSDHNIKILSLRERLNIAIDVSSALDYLHHSCHGKIVHCDLKPSNVLLDEKMIAHVGDFGLSKFIPDASSKSRPTSSSAGPRGTIGYAAPEYGIGSKYTPEGDVYSFGILLLEMFTGKRPTDSAFNDGVNLHSYAKKAFPDRVKDILDVAIVQSGGREEEERNATDCDCNAAKAKVDQELECLISIIRIGVACSMESPKQRMDIADSVKELQLIRDILLASTMNECSSSGSLRFGGSSSRSVTSNWQNIL